MRVALVAGELSGDRLGAGLIRALRERSPHARFEGIAGPAMVEEGCRCLYPMERLSVAGLVEAVPRYFALLPVRNRLARAWIADPPDVFVGVDAPDFNLALEVRLRRAGIRTVHYVSPSVWAWRRYRVRKIARAADLLLALFPFEPDFYADHGVRATFVGHPTADAIPSPPDREAARRHLDLPRHGDVVALLPGSRRSELSQLTGPMVEAALWLAARREGIRFVVPIASPSLRRHFEDVLEERGRGLDIRMLDGDSWSAMSAADAVLLASGTATLEALLHRRPMVITYRTLAVTWAIGRRLLHVSHSRPSQPACGTGAGSRASAGTGDGRAPRSGRASLPGASEGAAGAGVGVQLDSPDPAQQRQSQRRQRRPRAPVRPSPPEPAAVRAGRPCAGVRRSRVSPVEEARCAR